MGVSRMRRSAQRSGAALIRDPESIDPGSAAHHFVLRCAREASLSHSGVFSICPLDVTYHFSLANGLPAKRSAIQSATRIGGNGPRLADGTLPTEWRDS